MNGKKKLLALVAASIMMFGTVAPAMAMPDVVKVTTANGIIVQYSINDVIANSILMSDMNDKLSFAFTNSKAMVGILTDGKVVNLNDALSSGSYSTYEAGVMAGTIPQGTDLKATVIVEPPHTNLSGG